MLHFNELRISLDGKFLIVDVSVNSLEAFNNIKLDKLIIDTLDTYKPNGPSNNPVYIKLLEIPNNLITSKSNPDNYNPIKVGNKESYYFTQSDKSRRIIIPLKELGVSLENNIFFVYVTTTGNIQGEVPEDLKLNIKLGTVINLKYLYTKTINFIKELNYNCEIPKGFTDMILKLKALELCIRTGNYTLAIKYWNKFFLKF